MTHCNHTKLTLLPKNKTMLRCRHCHLKIKIDEVGEGYCPECFAEQGKKLYDFEEVETAEKKLSRYRCEECGIMIECK